MKARKQNGFTLLEILLVLLLIMILVKGIVPGFASSATWTRDKADTANRKRLEGAVSLYKADTGLLPGSIQDLKLQPSGLTTWRGPYIEDIPINPLQGQTNYQVDARGKVIAQ